MAISSVRSTDRTSFVGTLVNMIIPLVSMGGDIACGCSVPCAHKWEIPLKGAIWEEEVVVS